MALYSLGCNFDPGGSLTFLREMCEIRTSEKPASLFELTYINSAAATPVLAWSRSAVVGTGGTQLTFIPDNPNDPPATTFLFVGSWSRSPINTGIYTRRYFFASGNQGGAVMWTWRNGLIIPPNSSVVLWNISSTDPGNVDLSLVIEE